MIGKDEFGDFCLKNWREGREHVYVCWCCLTQGKVFMCHIKPGFVALVTVTLLLSIIAYTYNFSLRPVTFPLSWFNYANQTKFYNVVSEGLSGKRNVWNFFTKKRNETSNTETKPTASIKTEDNSIDKYVAHPRNYHFILDEPDKCKQDPFLVLMVPVAPHEVNARNAIRSTWGNESSVQGKAVLTLFLVGLTGGPEAQHQLEEESRQHRDLLQSNFVDSYFNLTIKTMVIMDWLATHCPQAAYAMKVDSDMYINLENLMNLLSPNTPRQNYITGYLMRNEVVVRNKNSKWYVAEELYPEPTYPTYLLGMGYVFSNDLPEKLVQASKKVKPFNIEDAYVGACLKQLGVAPSSPPNPSQFKLFLGQDNREDFLRVIATILRSPQELIKIWKDLKGLT